MYIYFIINIRCIIMLYYFYILQLNYLQLSTDII